MSKTRKPNRLSLKMGLISCSRLRQFHSLKRALCRTATMTSEFIAKGKSETSN